MRNQGAPCQSEDGKTHKTNCYMRSYVCACVFFYLGRSSETAHPSNCKRAEQLIQGLF